MNVLQPASVTGGELWAPHALGIFLEAVRLDTNLGDLRNKALVTRSQNLALAAVRSFYTDDPALYPAAVEQVWQEL